MSFVKYWPICSDLNVFKWIFGEFPTLSVAAATLTLPERFNGVITYCEAIPLIDM